MKLNKKVMGLIISGALVVGSSVIGYNKYNKYNYYVTGKNTGMRTIQDVLLEGEGENNKEKILDSLLLTLNEESKDGGLDTVNANLDNGKTKKLSLTENRKYFDEYRKGMIKSVKNYFEDESINGLKQTMFAELVDDEDYEYLILPVIERYDEQYKELMNEYIYVIELIETDFNDGKLDNNYDDDLERLNTKYNELLEKIGYMLADVIWDYALYNSFK
ncbi:MAG: hypothetical protein ACI4XM_00190 [Candidatus Coprovivens sp.]